MAEARFPAGVHPVVMAVIVGAVLACQTAEAWTSQEPARTASSPRATDDCPDDSALPQIHLIYAIPRDGFDQELDGKGLIAASVASAQDWLASESGGSRLRFDTCGDELDITFVRLPRTDREYAAFDVRVRDQVEYDLWTAGFSAPHKIYAVYYGGTLPGCGQGPHPPHLSGNVVVLAPKTPDCDGPFPGSPPEVWELTLIHEVFHALGAVSLDAPHHCCDPRCAPGHVQGPTSDLMSAPEWTFPSVLDHGRDDYWGHSDPRLVDVSRSAFLHPTPAYASSPPVWPLHQAVSFPPSQEPTLRSPQPCREVQLQIVNRSGTALQVHWLDHSGVRIPFGSIAVDEARTLPTHRGHLWVIADDGGTALAIYRAPDRGFGRAVYTAP